MLFGRLLDSCFGTTLRFHACFPGFLYNLVFAFCIHATLQKVPPKPAFKEQKGDDKQEENVEKSQGHREPHGSKSCFAGFLIMLPALILRGFHVCFCSVCGLYFAPVFALASFELPDFDVCCFALGI